MEGDFKIVQDDQLAEAILQFKAAIDSLRIVTDLMRNQIANPPPPVDVNVAAPDVTVETPEVTVRPMVQPPDVIVNVPSVEPPDVIVNVQVPEHEKIGDRGQPKTLRVERNSQGYITKVVEE